MKKLLILGAAAIFASGAVAQETIAETETKEDRKVEHIMELVDVDQATAERTVALLDEFKEIKQDARKQRMTEKKALKEKMEDMDDDEIEKLHRQRFDDQRAMIELEETYYNKMLELMPASKVEKVLKEARKHLHEKMRAQRMQQKGSHERDLHE